MYTITYDFDETTGKMSNWKCVKKESKTTNSNGKPVIEVGENKIIISPEALALIGAKSGERISINYIQKSNELTIPVIGKSEVFSDERAGNKLTLSNTVSFKGKQRTILLEYGTVFVLGSELRPGMFQLTSVNEDSSAELASEELKSEVKDLTDDMLENFDELDSLPF